MYKVLPFLGIFLILIALPVTFASTGSSATLTFKLHGVPQAGWSVQVCPFNGGSCITKITNSHGSVTISGKSGSEDGFTATDKGTWCTSGYFTFPGQYVFNLVRC